MGLTLCESSQGLFSLQGIGLVEVDGGARESALGMSALALYALGRAVLGHHHRRLVVGLELGVNVRLQLFVADANRVGSGLGVFERVGNSQRDELAVVANDIVPEWPGPHGRYECRTRHQKRTEETADVHSLEESLPAPPVPGARRRQPDTKPEADAGLPP